MLTKANKSKQKVLCFVVLVPKQTKSKGGTKQSLCSCFRILMNKVYIIFY